MMKKFYNSPRFLVRKVKMSDVIITSDPQATDEPSDGGAQLIQRREGSGWDEY